GDDVPARLVGRAAVALGQRLDHLVGLARVGDERELAVELHAVARIRVGVGELLGDAGVADHAAYQLGDRDHRLRVIGAADRAVRAATGERVEERLEPDRGVGGARATGRRVVHARRDEVRARRHRARRSPATDLDRLVRADDAGDDDVARIDLEPLE